jgi:phosphoribosyl 1,2-cyclic phosphodiesterase
VSVRPASSQIRLDLGSAPLELCMLASGSKGNSLVLRSPAGCLLVDAGLSARELLRRLALVGVKPAELCGVVLSHAHSDHSAGLGVLCRKLALPVYLSEGSRAACGRHLAGHARVVPIRSGQPIALAGMELMPFATSHDCREPLMFRVEAEGSALAVVTDLGIADPGVTRHLCDLDLLVLEANHDLERLLAGPYPWPLKQRVRGPRGHLSNRQAAELLCEIRSERLQTVVLAHLSETNNTPALALATVSGLMEERGIPLPRLEVASQNGPGLWHQAGTRVPARPLAVNS